MAIIEKRKPDFVQCTKSGFLVKRADAVPHSTRDGAKAAVGSIEEAEEPKRNLVVAASHLGVVAGEDDVGVALDALAAIADVDFDIAVDAVESVAASLVDGVVSPEGVDEIGLHDVLLGDGGRVDGVDEIRVVEENRSGFLGESFVFLVNKVDESGFFEILEVVHHRCARSADLFCETAHVGRGVFAYSEEIEELFDTLEVLQLDLLDEQNVDFDHGVHRAQELFGEVAAFKEEGVVTVVEILLEVLPGAHFGQNGFENALVILKEFFEGVGAEVFSGLQIDEFAEGESVQPVLSGEGVEFGVVVLASAHRSGGVDDTEQGEVLIALDDLLAPVG